jgi:hypothetical protein
VQLAAIAAALLEEESRSRRSARRIVAADRVQARWRDLGWR